MGEVFLAEDTKLGRMVAIKILPADMARDPKQLGRFLREAKAASSLSHPNVTHLYEVGEADGIHFITMEHVDGQTLQARLEAPVRAEELVDITLQVAGALQFAHSRGIIHRDIKPANIMINTSGAVKVLDFGLARMESEAVRSNASTELHTRPGAVMGTVHYMSPEQALGNEVDSRSDLFSLGIVMYEMAAGRRPFSGATTHAVLDHIVHAQPEPILRSGDAIPVGMERIIFKCLRKQRDERYQSPEDLIADLNVVKRELAGGPTSSMEQHAEYMLPRNTARAMFLLIQLMYLVFYFGAMRWPAPMEAGLSHVLGSRIAIALSFGFPITAMIGIAVRLYLLTTVLFDHVLTGVRYRKAFPYLFLLDELWSVCPIGLSLRIGEFLTLACVAPLVFSPFSQRTLIRSAYDMYSARRTSTAP